MATLSKHHFWQWFQKHHTKFPELLNMSKKETIYWTNELSVHLRAYHKSLNFLMEWGNEQATLTLTVGANRKYFKKVDDLVAKAPVIPGWRINALVPPGAIDCAVNDLTNATGIDPEEFRFSFLRPTSNQADLVVFHPLHTTENDFRMYELAYQSIFNLLGERSFATNIRSMDVANTSASEPDKLEKLDVLPVLFNAGSVVDREGNLVRMSRWNK